MKDKHRKTIYNFIFESLKHLNIKVPYHIHLKYIYIYIKSTITSYRIDIRVKTSDKNILDVPSN